jgi:hypothetical protein
MQQSHTRLGIADEGIQKDGIFILHDLLQSIEHGVVQMNLSHLFTP